MSQHCSYQDYPTDHITPSRHSTAATILHEMEMLYWDGYYHRLLCCGSKLGEDQKQSSECFWTNTARHLSYRAFHAYRIHNGFFCPRRCRLCWISMPFAIDLNDLRSVCSPCWERCMLWLCLDRAPSSYRPVT